MIHSEIGYQGDAVLNDVAFENIVSLFRNEAEARDLDARVSTDEITITVPYGSFGARQERGHTKLFAQSSQSDWLSFLKNSIMERLAESLPDQVQSLRWSDDMRATTQNAERFPSNFNLAKTVSVTPVGAGFLRVRVCADDLSRFMSGALHFRLVLPNESVAAQAWPRVAPNGQTAWPKGDQALHKPVYTVRNLDVAQGWLEFDVFVHEGGRVTGWAKNLQAGQVVGLAGPAGGGIPHAPDIILAGDETAFPAIARILAAPDRPKSGEIRLFSDVRDYDFTVPDGYQLHWVSAAAGPDAFVSRLKMIPRSADSFIWFGGEKSIAQTLRAYFRDECEISTDASYISGYWRNPS